jgi:hypothetical protein
MPRIEFAGHVCLRRPRPTLGYRDDDDDDSGNFTFGVPDCELEVVMYPKVSGTCQVSAGFIGFLCLK